CLHLQFYKDSKERYKNGPTKASLSLEHFLGIESGFTLDKESNTIAILCQDVIVNLAFDTREILMQWQVKISSNLGDDIQYLVLVASAATKVKIPAGPARLHIQNHRFCITTGIPPRLSGMWNIAHLRRYGVVENRFCFEGGSSSGKCEGFVVLITDYGDEISNCFKMASLGRLNSNSRFNKPLDSPRKMKDTQSLRGEINLKCDCSNASSFWPSQESRGIDSFIGCDSSSFIDEMDTNDELNHFSRKRLMTMERCMSCSSKRSLIPTMSRSSTITDNTQNLCFGSSSYKNSSIDAHQRIHLASSKQSAMDRISMRSQESCGNISEFSISRPYSHHHSHETSSHRSFSVPRSHEQSRNFVGSYENYDSPKILSPTNENQMENYDKPRSVKMYLEQNVGGKLTMFNGDYGNYDTPNIPKNVVCGCMANNTIQSRILNDDVKTDCTCHRVMSWADNWIPCRRGNGIENTGVPVSRLHLTQSSCQNKSIVIAQDPMKCKLSDFSTSETDKSSLYALVDPSKKQMKRLIDEQSKPIHIPRTSSQTPNANYANLEFEKSLEIYENAKEVLKRENILCKQSSREETNKENCVLIPSGEKTNENYLVMEIQEKSKTFPGYISMHPVNSQSKINEVKTLPSTHKTKKLLLRLEEKSYSNPDLNRPCLDFQRASLTIKSVGDRSNLVCKKSLSVDSFRCIESEQTSSTVVEDEAPSIASNDTYQDVKVVDVHSSHSNNNSPRKQPPVKPHEHIKVVNVRHGESPTKLPNRDSSSSNDSGVSTASAVPKEYNEFELPLINQIKKRRQLSQNQNKACVHASLIRRSKSFDPFGDLSFQFTQNRRNANGSISIQNKSGKCPSLGAIMTAGHIDSNSTSSGTSDMSDYIETLSLSSHSSSDIEALRNKHTVNTMRPRSGKEYQNIDRAAIALSQNVVQHCKSVSPVSSISSTNINYVNITPVPESSESPSPGYQSSSSFQEEFPLIKDS
ncbi:CLUMA_CG006193, isoform A, partial [Clunio marinus]